MTRSLRFVVLLLLIVVLATTAAFAFPRTVVDGIGNEIYLESPPERIFSVALALDNIVLSLVEPKRVVGVSPYASQPEWGSYVADLIGDHMVLVDSLTPEVVLAAQPDIVLVASWNNPDAVEQLRQLGVKLYTFTGFGPVSDALDNIRRMGEITGEEDKAAALIDQFYRGYGEIAFAIADREKPRVLYWDDWGTTYGPGMSYHDLLVLSGGINTAAEIGVTDWATIDAETVIQLNPDIIVTEAGEAFVEQLLADPVLQTVKAVQNGRVYHVDHMGALNEKYILAIEQLARLFHPEAFAQ